MGEQLGRDLSNVRVHTDSEADGIARSMQALAFTHGADIYFQQGTYAPTDQRGQHPGPRHSRLVVCFSRSAVV